MRMGLCLTCVIALAVPAVLPGQASKKGAAQSAASRLVVMPAADLKWTDLDPTGATGVKVADLWGNHAKGPFGAFFKLPAGFAVPLHTHERYEGRDRIRDLRPGARGQAGIPDRPRIVFPATGR